MQSEPAAPIHQRPFSSANVVAAIDINRPAGDQLGEWRAQKRGGGADIEDIDEVAFRSTKFGLGQQLVEMGKARSRPCLERTRRDSVDIPFGPSS
jgi:hypothetical protein